MSDLPYPLTIAGAAGALRDGATTSVDLTTTALEEADAADTALGVFISRYADQALEAAAAADRRIATGAGTPLTGIPLAIKDIITTADGETTAQSLVLDRAWGQGDAPVAARLRAAGAVFVGKTTTMEFAIGTPDPEKPFPIPRNPWDPATWPGGSSSGTGAGVAASMFLGGLGTDTGGSIRMPSAYCGISGLMPTFGRVPKSGCVPLGYSLDHIGPMARGARDCALMLNVMAGYDASDPCSVDEPVPDYTAALDGRVDGVRIGYDRLSRVAGPLEDPAVPGTFDAALAALADAGADLVEIELPYYAEMVTADMVTLTAEAFAYHAPDLEARWPDFSAGTRRMIGTAIGYSAADYVQAQRVRRVGQRELARLYERVDLVVTPTAATGAPPLDDLAALISPERMNTIYTAYWDSVGNPVISVPMGFTAAGLPLGVQLAGRPFEEALVLRGADAYQRRTDWHLRRPTAAVVPATA
jgi:aspartyl-tRNA(Asn)/glutamyl-tRNA(Gln) amidotransferase subunit A